MTQSEKLLFIFARTVQADGGIHTATELAYMLGVPPSQTFTKFLSDCAKRGIIRRVANGIFESTLTPVDPMKAAYKIAKKLRGQVLTYISLESQLSYTGDISQLLIDRITFMTKGRSGTFATHYGVLEFTNTKQSVHDIAPNLYFDSDIGMYRANTKQAKADLVHCNRNIHMLDI